MLDELCDQNKKIREPFHFEVFLILHIKRYGIRVSIGHDLQVSSPVCRKGVVRVLPACGGHVEVTPDIDLDSMKYKGSLIFGSAYTFSKDYTKKPFPKLWKSILVSNYHPIC